MVDDVLAAAFGGGDEGRDEESFAAVESVLSAVVVAEVCVDVVSCVPNVESDAEALCARLFAVSLISTISV